MFLQGMTQLLFLMRGLSDGVFCDCDKHKVMRATQRDNFHQSLFLRVGGWFSFSLKGPWLICEMISGYGIRRNFEQHNSHASWVVCFLRPGEILRNIIPTEVAEFVSLSGWVTSQWEWRRPKSIFTIFANWPKSITMTISRIFAGDSYCSLVVVKIITWKKNWIIFSF